jgi:hypothetical protein
LQLFTQVDPSHPRSLSLSLSLQQSPHLRKCVAHAPLINLHLTPSNAPHTFYTRLSFPLSPSLSPSQARASLLASLGNDPSFSCRKNAAHAAVAAAATANTVAAAASVTAAAAAAASSSPWFDSHPRRWPELGMVSGQHHLLAFFLPVLCLLVLSLLGDVLFSQPSFLVLAVFFLGVHCVVHNHCHRCRQ